jgi:hypothetical protein
MVRMSFMLRYNFNGIVHVLNPFGCILITCAQSLMMFHAGREFIGQRTSLDF